jgi:ATP-dependent helicase/DNAse subunit B
MKFFYRYVNNLKEPESLSKDIDPAMLGNILHEIMKRIYQEYSAKEITNPVLNSLISNRQYLAGLITDTIKKVFHSGNDSLISGNELIVRDVLMMSVTRILQADLSFTPFTIKELEAPHSFKLSVNIEGEVVGLLTGGTIDRIDLVNGFTRIVDYKTGTVSETIGSTDDLFEEDRKKDFDGWLQTMLYCEAYLSSFPDIKVVPSVYSVRK